MVRKDNNLAFVRIQPGLLSRNPPLDFRLWGRIPSSTLSFSFSGLIRLCHELASEVEFLVGGFSLPTTLLALEALGALALPMVHESDLVNENTKPTKKLTVNTSMSQ